MGCGGSKIVEPSHKPTYHVLNKPIGDEEDAKKIYEILEYWFCTPFTDFDKVNHIKDLKPPKGCFNKKKVENDPIGNLEKRDENED